MRGTEVIGLIVAMCVRMFCLLVLIAEAVVPTGSKAARGYIKSQREWINEQQNMIELEAKAIDNEVICATAAKPDGFCAWSIRRKP